MKPGAAALAGREARPAYKEGRPLCKTRPSGGGILRALVARRQRLPSAPGRCDVRFFAPVLVRRCVGLPGQACPGLAVLRRAGQRAGGG